MEVLKLMNTNPNWREVLGTDPYNITIKEEDGFVLLKYSQLNSDFSLQIVRECRGAIFVLEDNKWICVRRAFDKFGNYGENYAARINWATASVQEKVDGSLMSVWFYEGKWHLSTNGNINAFKAPLADFGISFGDYFCEALGVSWEHFLDELDPLYCYTYELVGPLNRVVISYEKPTLYAIGQRDMWLMEETVYDGPLGEEFNIFEPKRFQLNTLEDTLKAAEAMSKDEEGFVVCDIAFNRIKIKSPQYLMAARLRNNGVITRKRVLQMLLDETVDDFLAYCPQYVGYVNKVAEEFRHLLLEMELERTYCFKVEMLDRKTFWEFLCSHNFKYKDYIMKFYEDLTITPMNFIRRQVEYRGIGWLEDYLGEENG